MNRRVIAVLPPATLVWHQTVNCTISPSTLNVSSAGTGGDGWSARDPYTDTISIAQVWNISFYIGDNESMCGMTNETSIAPSYSDIDYAMYRSDSSNIIIIEGGSVRLFHFTVDKTKLCRIISDGFTVEYYYDNVLIYTSLLPPYPLYEYMIKCAIYYQASPVGTTINSF